MRILLDTNVWIANYLPAHEGHGLVVKLLAAAISGGHELLFPVLSAKDVFYLLSHSQKLQARRDGELSEEQALAINEFAWGCVENMAALAVPVGADGSDLWLARKGRALQSDLEDGLIVAAAKRGGADFLVSFDERLVKKAPVAALAPADMLALLEEAR